MHSCIDKLCQKVGPRYEDYSDVWDLDQWWVAQDAVKSFIQQIFAQGLTQQQVRMVALPLINHCSLFVSMTV